MGRSLGPSGNALANAKPYEIAPACPVPVLCRVPVTVNIILEGNMFHSDDYVVEIFFVFLSTRVTSSQEEVAFQASKKAEQHIVPRKFRRKVYTVSTVCHHPVKRQTNIPRRSTQLHFRRRIEQESATTMLGKNNSTYEAHEIQSFNNKRAG